MQFIEVKPEAIFNLPPNYPGTFPSTNLARFNPR
jgi:hypothetical protein